MIYRPWPLTMPTLLERSQPAPLDSYAELRRLSNDEGVSVNVLDRCRQFSEKFAELFPKPYFAARRNILVSPYPASKNGIKFQLTWTHYRTLLPLADWEKEA